MGTPDPNEPRRGGTGPGPDPGRADRDDPGRPAPEWRDPEWRGPGSRGRYPREQPSGREALTARSPLGLRAVLSGAALLGTVAAAVLFVLSARGGGGDGAWAAAAVCAIVAVIAAVDLVVVARRART